MARSKPRPLPPLTDSDVTRFWSKVDRSGGPDACWPWLGARLPKGYGTFKVAGPGGSPSKRFPGRVLRTGRVVKAHRVGFFLATGTDLGELLGCHRCDNPPCCNPAHLSAGTNQQNVQEAVDRGRKVGGKGERHGMAKLTEAEVAEIKAISVTRYARRNGTSLSAVARRYGVTLSCVSSIVNGQAWKGVAPCASRD